MVTAFAIIRSLPYLCWVSPILPIRAFAVNNCICYSLMQLPAWPHRCVCAPHGGLEPRSMTVAALSNILVAAFHFYKLSCGDVGKRGAACATPQVKHRRIVSAVCQEQARQTVQVCEAAGLRTPLGRIPPLSCLASCPFGYARRRCTLGLGLGAF